MARPENPGSQGQGQRDPAAPNPAGHQRGSQRPEGMTDAEWEAQREATNRQRFVDKHGREPGPDDDLEADDEAEAPEGAQ